MSRRKKSYPTKTTLNLVIKERSANYYNVRLAVFAVAMVLIGLFAKFAVIDVISAADALKIQAESGKARYAQLLEENAIYPEVTMEYDKHFSTVGGESGVADCMNVLRLIENNLMTKSDVQSASFTGNKLSVVLTGIDLEEASVIVRELYFSDLVSAVSVSSADTTVEGVYSSISMEINLIAEGGGKQ